MKTNGHSTGKITQVIGSTLDAEFPEDNLPRLYNALKVNVARVIGERKIDETLWCEVAAQLGGGRVRAIALGSTDGLSRGMDVHDTGAPVSVPVGTETLGRVFNLVGDAIDGLGAVTAKQTRPIYRSPPEVVDLI